MKPQVINTLKMPDDWPHRERALLAVRDVPASYTRVAFRLPDNERLELHARWLGCFDCGLRWREWRRRDAHWPLACGPCPAATPELMPHFVTKQPMLARLGGLS